jgi:hypothetical protein
MTTSEWISVIALIISTGAFSLQARSWLASGPRLRLHLMADAISIPRVDNDPKLALFVINRGDTPTTITHMVLYSYRSRWAKFRRKNTWAAVVNAPNVPAEVGVHEIKHDGYRLMARRDAAGPSSCCAAIEDAQKNENDPRSLWRSSACASVPIQFRMEVCHVPSILYDRLTRNDFCGRAC